MLRFLLVIVVVVVIAAWWLGYTPGRGIDPDVARQRGAQLGEQMATGINEAADKADDAAITTKIKAKMALDDLVRARDIDIETRAGVVTLTGRVDSQAEHQRAVQLARETASVQTVVDRLVTVTR